MPHGETARTLNKIGVKAYEIRKLEQESPNVLDLVLGHQIDLIIDIPAQGAERSRDGFIIRRNAIETGVNVLTSLDTAAALVTSLENRAKELTLIDIATVRTHKWAMEIKSGPCLRIKRAGHSCT